MLLWPLQLLAAAASCSDASGIATQRPHIVIALADDLVRNYTAVCMLALKLTALNSDQMRLPMAMRMYAASSYMHVLTRSSFRD